MNQWRKILSEPCCSSTESVKYVTKIIICNKSCALSKIKAHLRFCWLNLTRLCLLCSCYRTLAQEEFLDGDNKAYLIWMVITGPEDAQLHSIVLWHLVAYTVYIYTIIIGNTVVIPETLRKSSAAGTPQTNKPLHAAHAESMALAWGCPQQVVCSKHHDHWAVHS